MSDIFPKVFGPGHTYPGATVYPNTAGVGSISISSSYTPAKPSVSLQKGETSTFQRIGDMYLEIVESFEKRTAHLWIGGNRTALSNEDAQALQSALTETF